MKVSNKKAVSKQLPKDDGRIYGLLYDVVFKAVFGHKKNTRLLTILLNALLQLEGDKKIKSLTIQNPFSYQQFKGDKISIIDIKATDISGEQYCVEVQMQDHQALMERIIYYGSSRYSSQIKKGEKYRELKKTISLWIMQVPFLPDDEKEIHNCYTLHNEKSYHKLTDLIEFHFIEMHKFNENIALKSSFERWLHVLKFGDRYEDMESLPEELLKEEGVMEALETMKEVNSSQKARETIFLRNMHLSDIATIKDQSFRDGEERERQRSEKIIAEERLLREEAESKAKAESRAKEEERRAKEEERRAKEEERRAKEEERRAKEEALRAKEALEKELAELRKKMGK